MEEKHHNNLCWKSLVVTRIKWLIFYPYILLKMFSYGTSWFPWFLSSLSTINNAFLFLHKWCPTTTLTQKFSHSRSFAEVILPDWTCQVVTSAFSLCQFLLSAAWLQQGVRKSVGLVTSFFSVLSAPDFFLWLTEWSLGVGLGSLAKYEKWN